LINIHSSVLRINTQDQGEDGILTDDDPDMRRPKDLVNIIINTCRK